MFERLSMIPKGTDPAHSDSGKLGKIGEDLAVRYLETRGFSIVMRNFKVVLGRNSGGASVTGEIDVIALKDSAVTVVEVKTRKLQLRFSPEDSIDGRKRRQLARTAKAYARIFGLRFRDIRFAYIAIVMEDNFHKPTIRFADITSDF